MSVIGAIDDRFCYIGFTQSKELMHGQQVEEIKPKGEGAL